MSYDLYFYKKKGSGLTRTQITTYLNFKLMPFDESSGQWFFVNQETEVYFIFETNDSVDDSDAIELYEKFEDFDNTRFVFNINYMRPSFFGLEAFQFVEKFLKDLGLYVLNPQSANELPYLPAPGELFENWNRTNLSASMNNYDDESNYYPIDKSNLIWEYNFNRKQLQEKIGADYFVSRIFFCKIFETKKVATFSTWAEHIPNILPQTDYYLLYRQYKRLFKTVNDRVLISRETLYEKFGNYLLDYPYMDCKIIHPENALKVKGIFNSLESDIKYGKYLDRIGMDTLYNAKP